MSSRSAIFAFVRPRAIRSSTSRCRGVKSASPGRESDIGFTRQNVATASSRRTSLYWEQQNSISPKDAGLGPRVAPGRAGRPPRNRNVTPEKCGGNSPVIRAKRRPPTVRSATQWGPEWRPRIENTVRGSDRVAGWDRAGPGRGPSCLRQTDDGGRQMTNGHGTGTRVVLHRHERGGPAWP